VYQAVCIFWHSFCATFTNILTNIKAGGYDAVWVLVVDPEVTQGEEHPIARVERVWSSWTELDVSPLAAKESVGARGCRIENVEAVPGLKEALGV
jgi:phosphomevalonate kinase